MVKTTKSGNKRYLKISEIITFSLGLFGLQAIIYFLNSYQAEFYVKAGLIPLEKIIVIPFIIGAARLTSAFLDPFIGNLIDRQKIGKLGKLKPFILYSLAPLLLFTIIIFLNVPFRGFLAYFWIFITTTFWSIAMTMADVPSQGMTAVLTPDAVERTNAISIFGVLRSAGQGSPFVIVPILCSIIPGGASFFGGQISEKEYLWIAIITGIIGCFCLSLIVFKNKERVPYHSERMGFKDMYNVLKNNKYLMLIAVSFFLGFARQGHIAVQLQTATALLGSGNKIMLLGIPMAVGTTISMVLTPLLIKWTDEKKAYIGMSIYGFVASLIAFLIAKYTNYSLTAIIIGLVLVGLQFGVVNIMPMIMVADSVDYYEHKTGKRIEGLAYAVLSFSIKFTLAVGSAVCLGIVFSKGIGYDPNATTFASKTKDGVYFSYVLFPGITSLLAAIPMFFYDLTKEQKLIISKELNERRAALALETGIASTEQDSGDKINAEEGTETDSSQ